MGHSKKRLAANTWKYFVFLLSQRRHYIPILSIYFLTLPSTTAKQIGLYSGIGHRHNILNTVKRKQGF